MFFPPLFLPKAYKKRPSNSLPRLLKSLVAGPGPARIARRRRDVGFVDNTVKLLPFHSGWNARKTGLSQSVGNIINTFFTAVNICN
jgi:hypothetical protein